MTSYRRFALVYPSGDHSVMRYATSGAYEPLVMKYARTVLEPGSVVVDVGANVGLFALGIIDMVPESFVHCFEPSPVPYHCLERTIRHNALGHRVRLNPVALSETQGTVDFFVHDQDKSAYDGIRDTGWMGPTLRTSVTAMSLDGYLDSVGVTRVDALKIDVEGGELLVLKGAVQTLRRHRPIVILEIAQVNLDAYGLLVDDIYEFFQGLGYSVHRIDGSLLTREQYMLSTTMEYEFVARPSAGTTETVSRSDRAVGIRIQA
ncbi:FkbM family methyltransferase [Nitrospira sp. Nam80]